MTQLCLVLWIRLPQTQLFIPVQIFMTAGAVASPSADPPGHSPGSSAAAASGWRARGKTWDDEEHDAPAQGQVVELRVLEAPA